MPARSCCWRVGLVGALARPAEPARVAVPGRRRGRRGARRRRHGSQLHDALRPLAAPLAFVLVAVPLAASLDHVGVFDELAAIAARSAYVVGALWILAALDRRVLESRRRGRAVDAALHPHRARSSTVDPVAARVPTGVARVARERRARRVESHEPPRRVAALARATPTSFGTSRCRRSRRRSSAGSRTDACSRARARAGDRFAAASIGARWSWGLARSRSSSCCCSGASRSVCRRGPRRSATEIGLIVVTPAAAVAARAGRYGCARGGVGGARRRGRGAVRRRAFSSLGAGGWRGFAGGAVSANVLNNLPAILVGLTQVSVRSRVWPLLLGVNLGPSLVLTGSLAGLLWQAGARAGRGRGRRPALRPGGAGRRGTRAVGLRPSFYAWLG